MAPAESKIDEDTMKPTNAFSSRVTRSSTRRVNANNLMDSAALPDLPPAKKAKTGSNLTAKNVKAKKKLPAPAAKELELPASLDGSKTIVIEHCKQCNAFKTRAIQVKNGLEDGLSGITVLLNPGKPRRGCFEIREEGGETFLSLLDMKRPFKSMKELDMDKVILDIIDKFK